MSTFTTPTRVFRVGEAVNHAGAARLFPVGTALDSSDRRGVRRYTKIAADQWQMPAGSIHPDSFIADAGDFHHIVFLPEEPLSIEIEGRTYGPGDTMRLESHASFDVLPVGTVIRNNSGRYGETTKIGPGQWRRSNNGRVVNNGSLSVTENRIVSLPDGTAATEFEHGGSTYSVGARVEGQTALLDALPVGTILRYVNQGSAARNGATTMKRTPGTWSNRNDHRNGNRASHTLSAQGLEVVSFGATTTTPAAEAVAGFSFEGRTYRVGDEINSHADRGLFDALPVGTVLRYPRDRDWSGETVMKRTQGTWSDRNDHERGVRTRNNLQSAAPFTIESLPTVAPVVEESASEAGTFTHAGVIYRPGVNVTDFSAFQAFPAGTVLEWRGDGTSPYQFHKREDGMWFRTDRGVTVGGRDSSGLSTRHNYVVSFPVTETPVVHFDWTMDGHVVVRQGNRLNDRPDREAFLAGLPVGSVIAFHQDGHASRGYRLTKVETDADGYDWLPEQIDPASPVTMRPRYRSSSMTSNHNVFVSVPAASLLNRDVDSHELQGALPIGTICGTHSAPENRWEKTAPGVWTSREGRGGRTLPRISVSAHFIESLPSVIPAVAEVASGAAVPVPTLAALEALPSGTRVVIDPSPEREWVRTDGGLAVRAVAGVSLPLSTFESRCVAGHVSALTGAVAEVAAAPTVTPTPTEPERAWFPAQNEWVWVVNDGSDHGMRHYYDLPSLGRIVSATTREEYTEDRIAQGRVNLGMRGFSAEHGGIVAQTVPVGAMERADIVPSRTPDSWWKVSDGRRTAARVVLYVDSSAVVTFTLDGEFVSVGRDESGSDAVWLESHSLMRSAPEWGARVLPMARGFASYVRPAETPAPVEVAAPIPAGYRLVPAETIDVSVDLTGTTEYEIGLATAEVYVHSDRTFDVDGSDTEVTLNWSGNITVSVEVATGECGCGQVDRDVVMARLDDMGATYATFEIDGLECEHC